ncbi:ferrous iron transport protein B [Pseudomarimonas arenosa]|uniref:Ferrous iron transport protein B n=1 Tax=Pseudomarimonas arenosa TaxID=2774145 RepID=A0AAW3ZMS0_9GAMM|nr:ferrous iron transport protein B [Pseudomarimonas arenosa]MBD8526210.1 ferrous iron transport protein B [Pseudomarimonas arenosa]
MSATLSQEPLVALLGTPNCGKTALFNLLTGSRQKVANYAGVTVERKEGSVPLPSGRRLRLLDLPGAYSLNAESEDEVVTRGVLLGDVEGERVPDLLVCVCDATQLQLNLRLVLELKKLGQPMLLALNMSDLAEKQRIAVDLQRLSELLGIPVVRTVGVRRGGANELLQQLDAAGLTAGPRAPAKWSPSSLDDIVDTHKQVRHLLEQVVQSPSLDRRWDEPFDRLLLHPVAGLAILAAVLFCMFQAVFIGAEAPMGWIEDGATWVGEWIGAAMADGPLRSLLVDGIIAGVGGVLVFLPQILILFAFILALEDSGYLPRAAFLLDRFMGKVGLSGRSFIPLLSSFACAIPGIMATRTIPNRHDRLVTILIAPLMTCSARLPVYALLIAAFIPTQTVGGVFSLQGLVLFGLYLFGVLGAIVVAFVLNKLFGRNEHHPLLLELPAWKLPNWRNLSLGLYERAKIFLRRVGGIILTMTIVIWALSSYPLGADGKPLPITESFAGMLGKWIQPIFAPLGFDWQICIALVPGMAAREVAVGALGTVYALSAEGDAVEAALIPILAQQWSIASALALLAWFVFAPQCISTIAIVKRETQSWKTALGMTGYLFALAWLAGAATYQIAVWAGLG